jgi:two-component system response regulator AtoC
MDVSAEEQSVNARVLVIGDERAFRLFTESALSSDGFEVRATSTLLGAEEELVKWSPDVLLLNRTLPDGDGVEFLKTIHASPAAPIVVIVAAYGDVCDAVEALHAGAWDYLTKPAQLTDLVIKLRKVLETRRLRDQLDLARTNAAGPPMAEPKSEKMRSAIERLRKASLSRLTPVLLVGRSGVGKQYAAELLHTFTFGSSADAPFVDVNCAALRDGRVDAELFGIEDGALNNASTRRGLIQLANGGTLFLDEVTELPLRSHVKLLEFIDTMQSPRTGREAMVECRVVAATKHDVVDLVRTGRFREELYHRLAVLSLRIPLLSERKEDIFDLASVFVRFFAARTKKRVSTLSPEAVQLLMSYGYPGNVRELRYIIERAVILAHGAEITGGDLMLPTRELAIDSNVFRVRLEGSAGPPPLKAVERAYVARVLEYFEGHRRQAAEALAISYPTFLNRLRELGLDRPR